MSRHEHAALEGMTAGRGGLAVDAETLRTVVERLCSRAGDALALGPWSVVNKRTVAPSGDQHDYVSVGPYWWPNGDSPDGFPYVHRDGQVNPEYSETDAGSLTAMFDAVQLLSCAWHFTGDDRFICRVAELLRTWFLDERTRMNPHLSYAQGIPGTCTGRCFGIIETHALVRLPIVLKMLAGFANWSSEDAAGMTRWAHQYLTWLTQSAFGREESVTRNNHGTWFDAQVVAFAMHCGESAIAQEVLKRVPVTRIAEQIDPDGRQPAELRRSRSFTYSVFNLEGLIFLAEAGEQFGLDLWKFETPDGRGLRKALERLAPYAVPGATWPYAEVEAPGNPVERLVPLIIEGSRRYVDSGLSETLSRVPPRLVAAASFPLFCRGLFD